MISVLTVSKTAVGRKIGITKTKRFKVSDTPSDRSEGSNPSYS